MEVSNDNIVAMMVAVSFAAGLNLYATTATLGLLARFHVLALPGPIAMLSNEWVVGASLGLFAIEFFADKIPVFDLIWNALHTFVKVPAAALLAWSATTSLSPAGQMMATMAGGAIALAAHGGKLALRGSVTASPEPASNILLSAGEDVIAIGLTWFATTHPYLAAGIALVLVVLTVLVIRLLWAVLKRFSRDVRALFATVLVIAVVPVLAGDAAAHRADLLIRHVNVIDLAGGPTRLDQRILITGDRIVSVTPDDGAEVEAARTVDAAGGFVIPGLWDMHQHVMEYPGVPPAGIAETLLPLYIANGVLGVRDMGTHDFATLKQLREDIAAGKVLGPRLVITGRALDGRPPTDSLKRPVETAAEASQAVQDLKAGGADFVKVYERLSAKAYQAIADESRRQNLPLTGHLPPAVSVSAAIRAGQRSIEHMGQGRLRDRCYAYLPEGGLPPSDDDPVETARLLRAMNEALATVPRAADWTPDTYAWLQSRAGRGAIEVIRRDVGAIKSLTVLRRQPLQAGRDVALMARQERGERTYRLFVEPSGLIDWRANEPDVELPAQVSALAEEFRVGRTWLTPTLVPLRAIAYRKEMTSSPDRRLDYVTAEARSELSPTRDPRLATFSIQDWEFVKRTYNRDARLAASLRRLGVRILAGTDALTDFALPGFGLHDELALLVAAGLTPLEALQAATIEPAAYFDRTRDMGTVDAGKLADLVILGADPLADIHNTTRVRAVIRAGRYLDRSDLDGLLERVRNRVRQP